ncbi:MAG: hypothetical protein ACXVNF_12590 [Neobacillus sp.]
MPILDAFVKAAVTPGYVAETYAKVNKIAKYADASDKDDSVLFVPVVVETFGVGIRKPSIFFSVLSSWLTMRDTSPKPLISSR